MEVSDFFKEFWLKKCHRLLAPIIVKIRISSYLRRCYHATNAFWSCSFLYTVPFKCAVCSVSMVTLIFTFPVWTANSKSGIFSQPKRDRTSRVVTSPDQIVFVAVSACVSVCKLSKKSWTDFGEFFLEGWGVVQGPIIVRFRWWSRARTGSSVPGSGSAPRSF